jgi:tight adherence protein C
MQLYMILTLSFITVTMITFFVLWFPSRRSDPVNKRLRYIANISSTRDLRQDIIAKRVEAKKERKPGIERIVSTLSRFSKGNAQYNSKLRLSLMKAGFYHENSLRIFLSLKVLGAITMFLVWLVLGLLWSRGAPYLLPLGLSMPLMGYILPGFVLNAKIRRRQDEIARGLPDALDFMVICVEAGLGLNSALIRVGQELRLRCRALGEELLIVNQEMRTGMTREDALRHLSQRNQVEDLKILVGSLILADRLGTNITDTLRAQADSLRTRVRQRVEEKAAKAGIKLLFPLIFLILPALFIVILGPGIILVMKTLVPIVP